MINIFTTLIIISIIIWLGILIYFPIKYKKKVWQTSYSLWLSILAFIINILNIAIQMTNH
jgi:hypothetical protein